MEAPTEAGSNVGCHEQAAAFGSEGKKKKKKKNKKNMTASERTEDGVQGGHVDPVKKAVQGRVRAIPVRA